MTKAKQQLKVTLVRSLSGRLKSHKDTAQCLGLRRMHQVVIVNDIPQMRGMINKIIYLLKVEEV